MTAMQGFVYYGSILICAALGSVYKKIDDIDVKRQCGAGLGLLVTGFICGHYMYLSVLMVWGNIIIIKCCQRKYIHQLSFAYTWLLLLYLHLNTKCSIYVIWLHQAMALRLVGLAFDIHLASKSRKATTVLLAEQSVRSIETEPIIKYPSVVDVIAYSFFFIGLQRGPYFRWKVFEDHFTTPYGVQGDCHFMTSIKLKEAVVYSFGYIVLRSKYSPEAYNDDAFYKSFGSELRYLYSVPQLLIYFLHRQIVMSLCTSVCTEAAFGVYPAKCSPIPGHGPTSKSSLLKITSTVTEGDIEPDYNYSMLQCFENESVLLGPRMRDTVHGWDIATRYWFSTYIYRQLLLKTNTEIRSACSFLVWCVWSGPSLPRLIMSATIWMYVQLESEYNELYESPNQLKFPVNVGFSLMRMFCLLYLTPCIVVEDTSVVFRFYNSIYWVFHILMLILLMIVAVINKMRR